MCNSPSSKTATPQPTCAAKINRAPNSQLPAEDIVVETNIGHAVYHDGTWFEWWYEMKRRSQVGIKPPNWWKDENGTVHHLAPAYSVKIGSRSFEQATWRRRDHIFVGDTLIGVINLGEKHRPGTTICLANSAQKQGWSPQWCFEEYSRTVGPSA